ncbi:MAG: beta-ketoacyl-[acyl-carrier-protein] synthase family protein [Acidobacteria bacterium]|nr:beta-ketoacyl-[acyl-carrier-protein] synthase family protein [Acidobacteriota bacterium]
MRQVAVTGMGIVCGIGSSVPAFWRALCEGRSAVADATRFGTGGIRSPRVVEAAPFPEDNIPAWLSRVDKMAFYAAREALADSGLGKLPADAGVSVGTGVGGLPESEEAYFDILDHGRLSGHLKKFLNHLPATTADNLSTLLGLRGPRASVANACSSSTASLGQAWLWIASGEADLVLAGGADALTRLTVGGFNTLRVVSQDRPRPFDRERDGMVVGEGAAFLVMESLERALSRRARVLAVVEGYGLSSDAHHATQPHPEGAGALACMRQCLSVAGVAPEEVDHVNAHGTATIANDASEARAISALLKERASIVPVVSIKGAVGHCLGAAGALEAVATVLAIANQEVPPCAGFRSADSAAGLRVPAERERLEIRHAISLNLAFGGNDAALLFGRPA